MKTKQLFIYIYIFLLASTFKIYSNDYGLNLPQFDIITLKNGLKVHLAEHHEQATTFFKLVVPQGSYHDPIEKKGISSILATMLSKGTLTYNSEQIVDKIDYLGGSLGAKAGLEISTIYCTVLSKDHDEGLKLFSEIILNPLFPQKELTLLKRQLHSDLKEKYTDNRYLSRIHSYNTLLGKSHSLGSEQTIESLNSITQKDLKKLYIQKFNPQKSTLIVMGSFNKEKMLQKIKNTFESWTPKNLPLSQNTKPTFRKETLFRLVNKPNLTQGYISFITKGIPRNSKDYPAFLILNDILGSGRFSSRLMKAVRVEGGKTYGASSVLKTRSNFGFFRIATFTRNDEIKKTTEIILSELRKLKKQGVTDEEIKQSKAYYFGSIPLGLETPESQLNTYIYYHFHEMSISNVKNELDKINAVTKKDIQYVIDKYINIKELHTIILADYQKVKKDLLPLGIPKILDYKDPLTN